MSYTFEFIAGFVRVCVWEVGGGVFVFPYGALCGLFGWNRGTIFRLICDM